MSEHATLCPHCGAPNKPGATVCEYCEKPLVETAQAAAPEAESEIKSYSQPNSQSYSQSGSQSYTQSESQTPVGAKSKLVAALLGIFLGSLGIHKFYLGYKREGFIMLGVGLIGSMIFTFIGSAVGFLGLVEGVIYLFKSDEDFYNTYVAGRKEWL